MFSSFRTSLFRGTPSFYEMTRCFSDCNPSSISKRGNGFPLLMLSRSPPQITRDLSNLKNPSMLNQAPLTFFRSGIPNLVSMKKLKERFFDQRKDGASYQPRSMMRGTFDTKGRVLDDYLPPFKLTRLPFSSVGFNSLKVLVFSKIKSLVSWYQVKRVDKKTSLRQLKGELEQTFIDIKKAIAACDLHTIEERTSGDAHQEINEKLAQITINSIGNKFQWNFSQLDSKNLTIRFADLMGVTLVQVTACFTCFETVTVSSRSKVIGSETGKTREIWILERTFANETQKWKLVRKVPLPEEYRLSASEKITKNPQIESLASSSHVPTPPTSGMVTSDAAAAAAVTATSASSSPTIKTSLSSNLSQTSEKTNPESSSPMVGTNSEKLPPREPQKKFRKRR